MASPRSGKKKIEERDVSVLKLDVRNPRLALDEKASQTAILKKLYEEEAVDELALSLSKNGYFWEEPLVIVPDEKEAGKFVVVEGNRRLTAIKLLTDSAERRKVGVDDAFPECSPERKKDLQQVPTVLYPDRNEVIPYLGFRHITGVKKWDPYAKARYVNQLIEAGRPIDDIEEGIGDSARTVKKLYQAFVVHRQITEDIDIDDKQLRNNFSLLEVALGQQPIKKFLGLPRELPDRRLEAIVPDNKLEELREVVSWIYGDKKRGQTSIISDSRQIPQRLAPIVADGESLAYLRKTRDLEGAYEHSGGERDFLMRQLTAARRATERALGVIPVFKGNRDVIAEVDRLSKLVGALSREANS